MFEIRNIYGKSQVISIGNALQASPDNPDTQSSNLTTFASIFVLSLMTLICAGHFLVPPSSPLTSGLGDAFKTLSLMVISFNTGVLIDLRKSKISLLSALLLVVCLLSWMAMFFTDKIAFGILLLAHCALGAASSFSPVHSPSTNPKIGVFVFTGIIAFLHVVMILRALS